MRPLTASSNLNKAETKYLWKRYLNIKPQMNGTYCFKTIVQILDPNIKTKNKQQKNDLSYNKISSPQIKLKQRFSFKQIQNHKRKQKCFKDKFLKRSLSTNIIYSGEKNRKIQTFQKQNLDYKYLSENFIPKDLKVIFKPYKQQIQNQSQNLKTLTKHCAIEDEDNFYSTIQKAPKTGNATYRNTQKCLMFQNDRIKIFSLVKNENKQITMQKVKNNKFTKRLKPTKPAINKEKSKIEQESNKKVQKQQIQRWSYQQQQQQFTLLSNLKPFQKFRLQNDQDYF